MSSSSPLLRKPPPSWSWIFDATGDRVHGHQEGRFFHGYYGAYCFLPLCVFCGEQLLVSYLRPSNIDSARHAWAVLKLLVGRLREQSPDVKIIFRADSGFCRYRAPFGNLIDAHGTHRGQDATFHSWQSLREYSPLSADNPPHVFQATSPRP